MRAIRERHEYLQTLSRYAQLDGKKVKYVRNSQVDKQPAEDRTPCVTEKMETACKQNLRRRVVEEST
jgi:hypothetical protein